MRGFCFVLMIVVSGMLTGCEERGVPPDPKLDEKWIESRIDRIVRAPDELPPRDDQKPPDEAEPQDSK
ncbi:MAG: hypothetical protein N2234_02800, partial [Planctomycetota bacterium]|nr:hypothetical protein [Planctomycetota bacterium]